MLHPLPSERRRALLRSSALACAASLLLLPFALPVVPDAATGSVAPSGSIPAPVLDAPRAAAALAILRDPFVPDAATAAFAGPQTEAGTVEVEAVVSGSVPRALVTVNGESRIVRVGDALAGATVRAIDGAGIHLESGETLSLAADRR